MSEYPSYRHFKVSEFDQKGLPGSGEKMCKDFLSMLDELRDQVGIPFVISSGYRSPEYNSKVSTTGLNGVHTLGKAADILCSPEDAQSIVRAAMRLRLSETVPFFTGIGIAEKFIHLDCATQDEGFPRPRIWTYPSENATLPTLSTAVLVSGAQAFKNLTELTSNPLSPGLIIKQHGELSGRYIAQRSDGKRGLFVGA